MQVTPEFGSSFNKSIQSSEVSSQEFRFGGQFCVQLNAKAEQIANEALVLEDAKNVLDAQHKSRGKGKNKSKSKWSRGRGSSKTAATSSKDKPPSSQTATTSEPAPSAAGKSHIRTKNLP